jgi:hypothetical protein
LVAGSFPCCKPRKDKNRKRQRNSKGNLFLRELITLEESLSVDQEIQAWIKESAFGAGEEEKMINECIV